MTEPPEEAGMAPIALRTRLQRRELMWLGVWAFMWHRVVLTAMLSGPVLWLVGLATGGRAAQSLGATLSWLLLVVPVVAVVAGNWAAYRPGTAELYEPVDWVFAEPGVEITTAGGTTFAEWSEFRSWRRVRRHYLLYTAPGRYVIVAAAAIPEDRRGDFEALLERSIRHRRGARRTSRAD